MQLKLKKIILQYEQYVIHETKMNGGIFMAKKDVKELNNSNRNDTALYLSFKNFMKDIY